MPCPKCQTINPPAQLFCRCCRQILRYAKLRVVHRAGREQHIDLNFQEFTIGRDAKNNLVLQDEEASRWHARLRLMEGAYLAEDLGSKNGTYANEEKIASRQLASLDCLQIGGTRIYFVLHDATHLGESTRTPSSSDQVIARLRPSAEDVFAPVLKCFLIGARRLAQAECATLWLSDSSGDLIPRLRLDNSEASTNLHDRKNTQDSKQELALKIFQSGSTIISAEYEKTETFGEGLASDSEIIYRVLGIPLRQIEPKESAPPPFGVLILENNSHAQRLSSAQLERLKKFLQHAEILLGQVQTIAMILQQLDANGILETNVAVAIQERLRPVSIPKIFGYDLAGWYHPAEAVSGDYIDLISLPTTEVLIAVGDVAGKGMIAALSIFALQTSLHLLATYETQLEKIVSTLHQVAHAVGRASSFTTLFLGVLNPARRSLHYINAGHTPSLLIRKSQAQPTVELLHSNATALGVLETFSAEPRQLLLSSGSALLLFTDGITEAVNDNHEQYGLARLAERAVAELLVSPPPSAAHVLEALRAELSLYSADFHGKVRRHDDQAAVLVIVQ